MFSASLRLCASALILVIACVPLWVSAQPSGSAEDAAVTYLERNWNRHGLTSQADVAELVITDAVTSRRSGRTSVYLRQGIGGIPVIDGQMTVSVDANGHVFHASGQLITDLPSRAVHSGSGVSPAVAANTIASEAGFPAPEPFQVVEAGAGPTQKTTLTDGGGHTYLPVTAELVYVADEAGALRLAWDTTVPLHGDDGAWRGLVDASSGEVLRLEDVLVRDAFGDSSEDVEGSLVQRKTRGPALLPHPSLSAEPLEGECYQVFAWPTMDPFHVDPAWPEDTRSWKCDPFDPASSPGGWHDDDGDGTPDYTITRGNNVHAYADWTGSDPPAPDGGSELHFDFPIDFTQEPEDYVDAAVTNLFYWNNIIHDVMVHYGFDEAHGNFQAHNYTGDGLDGDHVFAEAQDDNQNACNNANFTFTVDGSNPRMQMYLGCNHSPKMDGDLDNHVIIHEYGHGVSVRMTGGPGHAACLLNNEQMGEGWSDWYGLMLTQNETAPIFGRNESIGVGVYLFYDNSPDGIRPAPYNTNFAVNDYTYGDTPTQVVPHGVGFVWATILWEVTWDLIDEYGFEQDITNAGALAGNTIMMNLVTEGLALQPCSPGFVDGRDAILEAIDVVYGDQPDAWREDLKYLMWTGFARRGLGYFADQGSSGSNGDNVEDFTVPSDVAPDPVTDLAATPDGDFVTLTWTAPGDDDSDVFNYHVRYATSPITDETMWDNAIEVSVAEDLVPQEHGTTEELMVTGLDFETTYHFAVRSDDTINTSALSNSEEVTTLAPPVADVPAGPIEVAMLPEETTTVSYTISNAGPSTLSYDISFEETTSALLRSRKAIPRSETTGDWKPPAREDETPIEPVGEAQLMGEGGPDAFGYRWMDSNEPGGPTYEWIDITETGTEVELDLGDYVIVDLPFDFPYYENTFNWVAIQSTGALSFTEGALHYANKEIPREDDWNGILAGYWDDLNPSASGAVYYDTLDDGRFVVSWVGVPHYPDAGSFTFQIILDSYGAIVYQYQAIDGGGTHDNSATIGIENLDGTDGLQVVYNAPYVEDELAIRFRPLWVESDPAGGQIAAGGEVTHTLTFESGGLMEGTYTADMIVTTNEAGGQAYTVPIELTIGTIGTEDEDLAFEGTHRLLAVAPNPISGLARTTLEVADAQDVTVELFDARGRIVATPFEGSLAARTAQEITLDGSALAPGVYVLRIAGETFAETRHVTIVR